MSDQDSTAGSVPTAGDARQALRYLARKGAYAVACADAGGDPAYSVHVEGAPAETLAVIPAGVLAQARNRGWLERDERGRFRLASAGVRALRKALSHPADPARPANRPAKRLNSRKAAGARSVGRPSHETPLAWLHRRKDKDGQPLITDAQYTAGERLAADYHRAHISRRVTSDWSGVAASRRVRRGAPDTGVELSDAAVAARERVYRALGAVGSELGGILLDVCCFETGLEMAEQAAGWPQRAAKVVLQLALTSLARHYGLIAPERLPFARLRHWGDEDYRPTIDGWR
jgi:hypothetical protein